MTGQRLELIAEQMAWLADEGIKVTDDLFKYVWIERVEVTVKAILTNNGFLKEGGVAEEGSIM